MGTGLQSADMSKILIIDAEGTLGDILRVLLAKAGHEVVTTADGVSGIEAYQRERPDLVLLDRDMPGMMAAHVLRSLGPLESRADVILLDRKVDAEGECRYRRMGARIFLSKSAGIETLLKVVARILTPEPETYGCDGYDKNRKPSVLVIDDDVRVRDMLKQFLEKKGYNVSVVKNGEEALHAVESDRPQMILLDVKMPKMNGVAALQEIRRVNADVPVMMITGQDDLETVRECLRLGAFDCMLKPLDFEYLATSVRGKLLTVV